MLHNCCTISCFDLHYPTRSAKGYGTYGTPMINFTCYPWKILRIIYTILSHRRPCFSELNLKIKGRGRGRGLWEYVDDISIDEYST